MIDIDVFQTVTSVSFQVEPNTNVININKVTTSGYSGVPNLQEVTDEGATTTNGITINVGQGGQNGISSISSQGYGVYGSSSETYGVYGNSTLVGVYGNSDGGYGVQGNSDSGVAVYGNSQNQIGIQGNSVLGTAISAYSDYGTGLYAASTEGVGVSAYSTLDVGLEVNGNGTIAIEANLGNSNKGLVINSGTSSTGNFIELDKNGVDKLVVNQAGELTATKLIKQGGSPTEFLMADGSVSTGGGGGSQDLQSVTDIGASTTNTINANSITTTIDSTINGVRVGRGNIAGNVSGNTAIGNQALQSVINTTGTQGYNNTAVGSEALKSLTTGSYNTAVGSGAGGNATSSGSSNILVGFQAGRDVSTGTNNLLIENLDISPLGTIAISTQIWTTKNLNVTTYSDGTVIPQVNHSLWAGLTTGAWSYYNNDSSNETTYGKLYNGYAVLGIWNEASKTDVNQRKKLAPTGYHVPSDAEWTTLTTYLGGESVAGGKMKATGTSLWQSPNTGATNESGFTGLPGGFLQGFNGAFNNQLTRGYFWSSSELETDLTRLWYRYINHDNDDAVRANTSKINGFSVRLIKDTNPSITSGSYNIILNPKEKSGVTTGSNNTIIGCFDNTLSSGLTSNVIIGNGTGAIRFQSTDTGLTTVPAQTNTLINGDASGKAVITKEYLTNSQTVFVPYTGATTDVNLGEFGIQLGNLEFDNTPTNIPTTAGSVYYNDADGTLDLILKGGNVTLQVGQETVIRVVNKTATNVSLLQSDYQAVRITGAQGQRPKVDLAQATNDVLSAETIGLVTETIANNQEGFITTSGLVRGINTTGSIQGETWLDGDVLYLSPTVAGGITKVKPIAPNHLIIIGYVISAHITQGTIFVKVDNGYELNELHNVKINGVANNNVLAYTSSTSIWENKTIETALGYTPYNATNPSGYQTASQVQTIADAKVANTITNGVTTSAPNQDVVFDALALKQDTLQNTVNIKSINGNSILGSGDLTISASPASQSAYTILANNTNASAIPTTQVYKDIAEQTYSGSPTWSGTAPTTILANTYKWNQVGSLVTVRLSLSYNVGGSNAQVIIPLPTDLPTPLSPTGFTGALDILYYGSGTFNTSTTAVAVTPRTVLLRRNTANNGYEFLLTSGTAISIKVVHLTLQYFT